MAASSLSLVADASLRETERALGQPASEIL